MVSKFPYLNTACLHQHLQADLSRNYCLKSKCVSWFLTFVSFWICSFLPQVSVGDTNIGHHLQWKYEPLFSGPRGLRRLAFIGQFCNSPFNGLFILHGNSTETGTGNRTGTKGNNRSWWLFQCEHSYILLYFLFGPCTYLSFIPVQYGKKPRKHKSINKIPL